MHYGLEKWLCAGFRNSIANVVAKMFEDAHTRMKQRLWNCFQVQFLKGKLPSQIRPKKGEITFLDHYDRKKLLPDACQFSFSNQGKEMLERYHLSFNVNVSTCFETLSK